jgi:hypothetical protein
VIPANTLASGDRVEIAVDFSHEGTATGFTAEVRWEAAAVVNRTAGAGEALVTGRVHGGIGPSLVYLSAENWGATLPHAVTALTATSGLSFPITVDFRGQMTAAGTDTVTLRSYRVVRYPATP